MDNENKSLLDEVFKEIRKGHVLLWAGAGFSRDAGLPSGKELKEFIEKRFLNSDNTDSLQVAARNAIYKNDDVERNTIELYQYIDGLLSVNGKDSHNHDAVHKIPYIKRIVTTNFDNLFEKAFGEDAEIIYNADTFTKADRQKVCVYKIHGDFRDVRSIVLTSEQYAENIGECSNNLLWKEVSSFFASYTLVFIGYSLSDINVEAEWTHIQKLVSCFGRKHYFISIGSKQEKIRELKRKGIIYIECDASEAMQYFLDKEKETLLPDIERGKISLEEGIRRTGDDGFFPKVSSTKGRLYISGIEPSKQGKTPPPARFKFSIPENSVESHRLQEFFDGKILQCSLQHNILNSRVDIAGYWLEHDKIGTLYFEHNPSYEGSANMFLGEDLFPELVQIKLVETKYI